MGWLTGLVGTGDGVYGTRHRYTGSVPRLERLENSLQHTLQGGASDMPQPTVATSVEDPQTTRHATSCLVMVGLCHPSRTMGFICVLRSTR